MDWAYVNRVALALIASFAVKALLRIGHRGQTLDLPPALVARERSRGSMSGQERCGGDDPLRRAARCAHTRAVPVAPEDVQVPSLVAQAGAPRSTPASPRRRLNTG
jgi:hypothetical protein